MKVQCYKIYTQKYVDYIQFIMCDCKVLASSLISSSNNILFVYHVIRFCYFSFQGTFTCCWWSFTVQWNVIVACRLQIILVGVDTLSNFNHSLYYLDRESARNRQGNSLSVCYVNELVYDIFLVWLWILQDFLTSITRPSFREGTSLSNTKI